ncbi:AN1-type zinc finger protein 4 [Electrophorus electricus]|uniref:Zinc finger, AN1-type domain 4 n=1 Tax=Electrophorus electricus TaxID=8005 RepID=A0A4W4F0R0_ELEEL|nr:AN1-type zinc finger protein 4 [Electrophorus electricus]
MADKREPPFFNDDNLGVVHYKLPFYETMELFIETLTGTCFQLRVSPFETVISVKAKIQRLEGIPATQQHLIWNSLELEDEYCLHDYSIAEGCTLKLVLAMRGGPINTRRVTVDDSVKDASDCLNSRQDEVWEKSLSNKQVTFLVYREGDQLNFFRVVDRGDGTLTPVSESLSGGPQHNVYTEEEEEGVGSSSSHLTLENSITMNKMKLLKAKMENMNLNKKPKKSAKLKVRPPVGPRPCSSSLGSARHHRMFRVLPQIGHTSATHLPPTGDQQQPVTPSSAASPSSMLVVPHRSSASSRATPALATSSIYMLQEGEPWNNPTPRKIRLPPKVSRLDVAGSKVMRDCVYPPLSILSSPSSQDEADPPSDRVALVEDAVLMESPKPVAFNSQLPEPLSLDVSAQQEARLDSLGPMAKPVATAPLLSQAIGADPVSTWPMGTKMLQDEGPSLSSLHLSAEPLIPPQMPQPFEFTGTSLRPGPSRTLLAPADGSPAPPCTPPQTTHLRSFSVSSPGERLEVISKSEVRDMTTAANKASKEQLGCMRNAALLASLAGPGSEATLAGPCALGRLCGTSAPLPASIHLLQEDLLRRLSPMQTSAAYMPSGILGSSSGPSTSVKRLGTPTYHLPPVKAPVGTKKKTSKHCFLCGKKTGLATSYDCRCGNNFCSMHRYAETHDCSYDYKSTGRRFLQESNPIISGQKLPKI